MPTSEDFYANLMAEAAESAALPSIQAPAASPTVSGPRELTRNIIAILPANGTIPIQVTGNFVYIQALSTNQTLTPATLSPVMPLLLKPDIGPQMLILGRGQMFRFPEPFTLLQLANPAGNLTVTINIVVGFGSFTEPREHRIAPFFSERTITRPANVIAYAANQYVGNTTDMTNTVLAFYNVFRPASRYSKITRAMIRKNTATVLNAAFSLYLFQIPPVTAIVDQAVWTMTMANNNPALARIQFPVFFTGGAGSDMAICDLTGLDITLRQLDGNPYETAVYGVLIADAAYVPGNAEAFMIALWGEQLG